MHIRCQHVGHEQPSRSKSPYVAARKPALNCEAFKPGNVSPQTKVWEKPSL